MSYHDVPSAPWHTTPDLKRARMEGRQMSFDDGVEYALGAKALTSS
jgi:hypothetical protein